MLGKTMRNRALNSTEPKERTEASCQRSPKLRNSRYYYCSCAFSLLKAVNHVEHVGTSLYQTPILPHCSLVSNEG